MVELGVAQHLEKSRIGIAKNMHIQDELSSSWCYLSNDDVKSNVIFYVVENENLENAFSLALRQFKTPNFECENLKLKSFDTVHQINAKFNNADLNKPTTSSILIGADGKNSLVRRISNIQTKTKKTTQIALTAVVQSTNLVNVGFQRFTKFGPIALLPMTDDNFCLIWSLERSVAEKLNALNYEDFIKIINNNLKYNASTDGDCFPLINSVFSYINDDEPGQEVALKNIIKGTRGRYILTNCIVDSMVSERVALIGDAAHSLLPLAGLGFNTSILDIKNLVASMEKYARLGVDLGNENVLRDYNGKVMNYNKILNFTINAIDEIFRDTNIGSQFLRSFGMNIIRSSSFLKKSALQMANR
ncbi:hypothetical protein A3Q56_06939 [Intoshia linei]|uniref:FAD-binding domain-containing protein n=1 Tax=Intoshia linei TaxID=1819745 RepID=A0A177ATK8_9BILA|nr:hypothetical protein A3Q56_06939 [Intoshia linei]